MMGFENSREMYPAGWVIWVLVFAAMTAWTVGAHAAPTYTITDLGSLGSPLSNSFTVTYPTGINNAGQVVGYSQTATFFQEAFLYSNGQMTNLGTLGGPQGSAAAINNLGHVVGQSDVPFATSEAFLYSDGHMNGLGFLGSVHDSYANGVNDSDQVVGWSMTNLNGIAHAFLYSSGHMTDLGTFLNGEGDSFANGINDSGEVVGQSVATGATRAFLYKNGQMFDLGTLGGRDSDALAINNLGQIVGDAVPPNNRDHAFLYSSSVMKDLGTLGGLDSSATAINILGQVVGESSLADNLTDDGFVYTGGQMLDLNSLIPLNSGWILGPATGINDNGQIVGLGTNPSGNVAGYLLTPVPEPTIFALLLGLGGFAALRRRR